MILSFDYILEREDKQQMKSLLNYVRDNGFVIQYKTDKQPCTKSLAAQFMRDDINDEAVLTLLYFVDKYLKVSGQPNFVKDLNRLLFQWSSPEILWDKEQIIDALIGTEAFAKGLYWVLYNGQTLSIGDVDVDCYSGNASIDITGIDGQTFNGLLSGTINKGKTNLPPLNGRAGIIDHSNEVFKCLTQTIMRFRNKDVHFTDTEGVDQDDPYFNQTDNESKSFFIRMDIIVMLMLAVQYQYDNLTEKVSCMIPALGCNPSDDMESLALQLVNERYIPGLLARQEDIIDEAFHFFSTPKGNHVRLDSINVMMRPLDLNQDSAQDYSNEDEDEKVDEDDVEIDGEQQEDPYTLLDRPEKNRVFLGGSSGSGKSTVVSKLIKALCSQWVADCQDQAVLPIRLNIRQYDLSMTAIDNLLVKAISNSMNDSYLVKADEDCLGRYLRHLREQGRLMMFFDGLNEAGQKTGYVINEVIRYCNSKEFGNCRCVVTSRIVELGEKQLRRFTDFSIYELCPLSAQLMKEQVRRASSFLPSRNIWERIIQSPKLQDIASNPQQLKLLLELLGQSDKDYVVPNKTILFEQVVEKLMEQRYGVGASDRLSSFNQALCCAAGLMMEQEAPVDIEWVKDHCLKQFKTAPSNIYELVRSAKELGIIDSMHPYISFKHDSWKEFYQASYVKNLWLIIDDDTRRRQVANLRMMLNSDNEEQLLLGTGLVCSIYELLDGDMADRRRVRERALLSDITTLLLTPPADEAADVILEKDNYGGVQLQFTGNKFPPPDHVLKVLARAISGMSYRPVHTISDDGTPQPVSDPKTIVEGLIMNLMLLYRKLNPESYVGKNIKLIGEFFTISVLSGSDKLLEELFHPYWLRLWIIHAIDFDKLMRVSSEEEGYWQERSYERRVALPSERKMLTWRVLADASNKPALAQRLMIVREELLRWGYLDSASIARQDIIKLLISMTSQDLKDTIAFCRNSGRPGSAVFINFAALLLDDKESMEASYINNKIEVPNIIVNRLIRRLDEDGIEDFVWGKPGIMKSNTLIALAKRNYAPLLEACRNNKLSPKDMLPIVDIIPLGVLPEKYVESHYDTTVFQSWPVSYGTSLNYKNDVCSMIQWNDPSKYHSSICSEVIRELHGNPALATEEVWVFFMRHNRTSVYTAFYVALSADKRKLAWYPTPDVCHVMYISSTHIHLFSPLEGYFEGNNIQGGLRRIANTGQKVSNGDLVILEQDGTMEHLPNVANEFCYGYKEGFIRGKTGRNYFIGIASSKEDFYFYDKSGQYDGMDIGEKVIFFPSVNLLFNNQIKPMAHNLSVCREQIRQGVLKRKNLEMVSDRKAYVLSIKDVQTDDTVTAVLFVEYLPPISLEYIENLQTGSMVDFRNNAFGKKRCYLVIPNKK